MVGKLALNAKQLKVSLTNDMAVATDGTFLVTFNATNWNTAVTVYVFGIAETAVPAKAENRGISEMPAGSNDIDDIDGAVYADGAGSSGEVTISEPMILIYNHKVKSVSGVLENAVDETNEYLNVKTAESVVGKSFKVAKTALDGETAESLYHKTITVVSGTEGDQSQVRRINEVQDAATFWVFTLNEAFDLKSDVTTPEFILTGNRDALFVNEAESVDRMFVNNQNYAGNASVGLDRLANAVNMSDAAATLASQIDAMRFTHSAVGTVQVNEEDINFAGFEYAEFNLGKLQDDVTINATLNRTDGFKTFTVFNTGDESGTGSDGVNSFDDLVTVNSYQEEALSQVARGFIVADATATDGSFQYTLIPPPATSSEETSTVLLGGIPSGLILNGMVVDVTTTSGVQRRVIKSAMWSVDDILTSITLDRPVTNLSADSTFLIQSSSVAKGMVGSYVVVVDPDTLVKTIDLGSVILDDAQAGDVLVLFSQQGTVISEVRTVISAISGGVVTIKDQDLNAGSAYTQFRIERQSGDGQLVINAQAGNDNIIATNTQVTKEGLIVFGGLGSDLITVASNAYVFGDRGQVLYKDESGKVVTRLGSDGTTPGAGGSDYATATTKGEAYLQTDGVNRGPSLFQTMDNDFVPSEFVLNKDTINITGDHNIVFGGNAADVVSISGSDNVAIGDGGLIQLTPVGTENLVWGDRSESYISHVKTVADTKGGIDTITTGAGNNVLFGGAQGDTLTTQSGDDVIVGDGGVLEFNADGTYKAVSNVDHKDGGNDVIRAGTGNNTVLGGVGDDRISTGVNDQYRGSDVRDQFSNDADVVMGDNGLRTFNGNGLNYGQANAEVRANASLSFNFQGQGQAMLAADTAGVLGLTGSRTQNWNNITGIGPRTYGNDPKEIITLDNGERASGLALSYGGQEGHRTVIGQTAQELNEYSMTLGAGATGGDRKLFGGGVRTSGPNDQCNNLLEVEMDGLSKYFVSYKVVVFLDAPQNLSTLTSNKVHSSLPEAQAAGMGESIRKVAISDDSRTEKDAFYLDDSAKETDQFYHTFNGQYIQANAKTANAAFNQYANYVVFENMVSDRFVVKITDAGFNINMNGGDIPSIAGIQVIGTYHQIDKVESSMSDLGGHDTINTSGGDDVVIGGAGNDVIATFGDVRDGVEDADVVFGDNASIVLMDRKMAGHGPEVSQATSMGFKAGVVTASTTFNDIIVTGNGNDVVVGGDGQDRINTDRIDQLHEGIGAGITNLPEALNGIRNAQDKSIFGQLKDMETSQLEVLSLNFTYASSMDQADMQVANGRYAGVVAAKNWNNVMVRTELNPTQYPNPYNNTSFLKDDGSSLAGFNMNLRLREGATGPITQIQGDTQYGNDQIDPDSDNSRMFDSYLWGQQQHQLEINLNNIGNKAGFETYDVYVYFDGENKQTDTDNWIYQIKGWSDSYSGERYVNDWRGNTFNGEFREVTANTQQSVADAMTPRMDMVGNYVVFRNVTGTNFSLMMKNVSSGTQNPMNLPGIAAIQVVGGANRTKVATSGVENYVPRSGDFDKDVVLGDNGKIKMTLDIPYGTNDILEYAENKVYTAKSMTESYALAPTVDSQSDYISTGVNQDVVMGGNGNDAIDAGVGADVVLGDNGKLELVDFNPIGVRVPLALKIMDSYQTQDNDQYIGTPGAGVSSVADRVRNNQAAGVSFISSTLGGKDIIDAGQDNDLVVGQEAADVMIANEGKQDVIVDAGSTDKVKTRDGVYTSAASYLSDLTDVMAMLDSSDQGILKSFVNNDFDNTATLGEIAKGLGSATPTTSGGGTTTPGGGTTTPGGGTTTPGGATTTQSVDISGSAEKTVTLAAGQSVLLTATTWPLGNQWWTPNLILVFNSASGAIPSLQTAWDVAGATTTVNGQTNSYYYTVNIPDTPNANGTFSIRVTAQTAGSFKVRLTTG
jgi:Ca2+-binding RTX toxin-like protein